MQELLKSCLSGAARCYSLSVNSVTIVVSSKDIPVTGHGVPHYLDKRLTDGGKVVSPTRRPHFTPRFLLFLKIPGTHFC
jgi:hypothetical protein